jgi:uncharacterized protein YcfL
MKKVLIILAFTLLPLIAIAQASNEDIKNNDTIETVVDKTISIKEIKTVTASASSMKAKALKLNRKKSIEIISIRAYRKSLQIKVKTVKLC